jgi:branched-chain amino acid transport system ATP-binding protein
LANSLRVEGLCAGYGAVQVLDGISLGVNDGETVTLLGTNGNGKSTLMKCIMGIVPLSAGRITAVVDGVDYDLAGQSPEDIVNLGIVLVPEGRRLFPRLTVEENLLLGAYRPAARAAIAKNLAFCFEAFPILADRRTQLAGSMSGGEQQMLTLARALMTAPKILLIDEPSVGLSPLLVMHIINQIRVLKERYGLAFAMASRIHQAFAPDRGYVIVHGRSSTKAARATASNNGDPQYRGYRLSSRRTSKQSDTPRQDVGSTANRRATIDVLRMKRTLISMIASTVKMKDDCWCC